MPNPSPAPPPVTASVTNAAGAGPLVLKQAAKIAFAGAVISSSTLSYATALPAQFKIAAAGLPRAVRASARLLITVRPDPGLPQDEALTQWSQRVTALTAIMRNAGLPDSRFFFGFEPDGV